MSSSLALRGWCGFLALVELPEIYMVLTGKKFKEFQTRLKDTPTARRLWAVFLSYLLASRVAFAAAPSSRAVAIHAAAVHIIEAMFMVPESQLMHGEGPKATAWVIIFNGFLFALKAMSMVVKGERRTTGGQMRITA
eukprot:TRINITY_DN28705_c0_g1_i1.p1 TRINITY_DN28705_c0_g1~~TRINITY_DN28705_c0_g1_i1.p1  ORF type:complete len:149 (+),score=33.92 TRINITY_DN28705_c0_g1_i1:37-447(+)